MVIMDNLALAATRSDCLSLPITPRQHPFLTALERVSFGHLTLVTPEGNTLKFYGDSSSTYAHLKLYDWGVLDDLLARGEIGFAEAYIQGRWASQNLSELLTFGLLNSSSLERFFYGRPWHLFASRLRQLFRNNSLWGSRRNVMAHYDLGNDFYKLWLDKSMTYSGALFEADEQRSLEEAQAAKYRRILSKLRATPGQHILEIGCGWGGFAEAGAREGLYVTAITLSEEQAYYTAERIRNAQLEHLVSIGLIDYRKMSGHFDHIVSIGMFEHVGERYWPIYFEILKKCLKPGGKAMVQSIILDDNIFEKFHNYSGFMEQVIFPGAMLPSKLRFVDSAEKAGLRCQETFAFGKDYERTAQEWLNRFDAHKDQVKSLGYGEEFLRLWRFYLSASIAAFRSGRTDVIQAEFTHVEE